MNAQVIKAAKIAAIFVAGAATGAGITYLALNKKYERILNEETKDIRDRYRKRLMVDWEKVKETATTEEPKNPSHISSNDYEKKSSDENFTDYTSYAKSADIPTVKGTTHEPTQNLRDELNRVSEAVHDPDFDEHMAEREFPDDDEDDGLELNARIQDELDRAKNEDIKPYAIGRAEYLNQKGWYDKLSWTLYEDGIITDERDEVIHHPEKQIGQEFDVAFGFDGEDPDIAYIRNDQRATDYEIMKTPERYYGESHGGEPTLHMSTEE